MASPMAEFNKKVIDEFHANGGKVGGQFAGAPMIIITHRAQEWDHLQSRWFTGKGRRPLRHHRLEKAGRRKIRAGTTTRRAPRVTANRTEKFTGQGDRGYKAPERDRLFERRPR